MERKRPILIFRFANIDSGQGLAAGFRPQAFPNRDFSCRYQEYGFVLGF